MQEEGNINPETGLLYEHLQNEFDDRFSKKIFEIIFVQRAVQILNRLNRFRSLDRIFDRYILDNTSRNAFLYLHADTIQSGKTGLFFHFEKFHIPIRNHLREESTSRTAGCA